MGASCSSNIPVALQQTEFVVGTCVDETQKHDEENIKREFTIFPAKGSADDVLLWMRHNLPLGLTQRDTQYLLNKQHVDRLPAVQLMVLTDMIQLSHSQCNEHVLGLNDTEVCAYLSMARLMY